MKAIVKESFYDDYDELMEYIYKIALNQKEGTYPFKFFMNLDDKASDEKWKEIMDAMLFLENKYPSYELLLEKSKQYENTMPEYYLLEFSFLYFIDNYEILREVYFNESKSAFIVHLITGSTFVLGVLKNSESSVTSFDELNFQQFDETENYKRKKIHQLMD